MNNKRGFTLIELIIVIAILAVLAVIAIPSYKSIQKKSIDTALNASVNNLYTYIVAQKYLNHFDDEQFFTYKKNQSSGGEEYFSRFLEVEWEVLNNSGDEDNSNVLGAVNPISNKHGIVNWSNPTGLSDFYQNQAVYISNSSSASYIENAPKTVNSCYKGSIIIWYDASYASNIYVYYVDTDGVQSGNYQVIRR